MDDKRNFVARIYVALDNAKLGSAKMTTSLNMTIVVGSEKDLEMAKRIFQSIRFNE